MVADRAARHYLRSSWPVATQREAVSSGLHFVYTGSMPSADTTTVRVRRPDSERLSALAKSRQTTVVEVVHTALDALERQEFMRGLNDDFRLLNPTDREALLAEHLEWDPLA
jgi:hypothetical protein